MTVTSQTSRYSYNGNGSTTAFSFPSYFIANADLKVYLRDADDVETLQVITTDYTVTGAGNPAGGTVTMLTAPASGETLVIYLDPQLTQSADYEEGGRFPAASHEAALDKLTQISQRTRELVSRSPRLLETDTDGSGAYQANGNRIADMGEPVDDSDAATKLYVDTQTGDFDVSGAQTARAAAEAAQAVVELYSDGIPLWGGVSTGSANAQVVTNSNFAYENGRKYYFEAGYTNSSAATLNGKALRKDSGSGPVALVGGEIVAGNLYEATYDLGSDTFHLASFYGDSAARSNLASASTCDLGTIASGNVNITGTTTITAFGSSASTDYPFYALLFAGALTLTHNATSLILPGGANITTAAGDTAIAEYLGSGNWRVREYCRASGKALVETDQFPTQTGNSGKLLTTNGTSVSWGTDSVVRARASVTNGTSATCTVGTGAVNIASVTLSGSTYTVTFTNALASTNYQVLISLTGTGGTNSDTMHTSVVKSTGSFTFTCIRASTNGAGTYTAFDLMVLGGY